MNADVLRAMGDLAAVGKCWTHVRVPNSLCNGSRHPVVHVTFGAVTMDRIAWSSFVPIVFLHFSFFSFFIFSHFLIFCVFHFSVFPILFIFSFKISFLFFPCFFLFFFFIFFHSPYPPLLGAPPKPSLKHRFFPTKIIILRHDSG